VEGDHLHAVRVLGAHLEQNLLEGVELAAIGVHVVLIDLDDNNNNNNTHAALHLQKLHLQ